MQLQIGVCKLCWATANRCASGSDLSKPVVASRSSLANAVCVTHQSLPTALAGEVLQAGSTVALADTDPADETAADSSSSSSCRVRAHTCPSHHHCLQDIGGHLACKLGPDLLPGQGVVALSIWTLGHQTCGLPETQILLSS